MKLLVYLEYTCIYYTDNKNFPPTLDVQLDKNTHIHCDFNTNIKKNYISIIYMTTCRYYLNISLGETVPTLKTMKERVSKLTYPMLQHCLRMLYTMNGNSKH